MLGYYIIKNKRKEWQFERVHVSNYMAALLFSMNRKDIGSGKSDTHIASSYF